MTKIVVFGGNGFGKDVIYSLDDREYKVLGIIDNDAEKIGGGNLWNIEVRLPEQIFSWDFDYVIVAIQDHYFDMKRQLVNLGVNEDKILVWKKNDIVILDSRIAQLHLCADRINEKNVKGNCAEVGVYKGGFAKYINQFFPNRKLYLFDTFEGFGEQELITEEKEMQGLENRFTDTSVEMVLNEMPNAKDVIIRKGYFPETCKDLEDTFAFVSLDSDLYQPIKDGLEYFYPRLNDGGYIFIHDYDTHVYPGVKRAVEEYCESNKIQIVPIMDRCLSVIIAK